MSAARHARAWGLMFALGAQVLLLCGCASTPPPAAPLARPKVVAPAASDLMDADLSQAMGLLYKGDETGARKMLVRVLKHRPGDLTATSLLQQIDTAPEILLGQESFAYKSRPDDSFSSLAERFLGDPILFYALARYNHVQVAGTLDPGLTLRIPGRAKPAAPRPARQTTETPDSVAKPHLALAPPAPLPPPANPHRAVQLRAAGLEQLNRGAIDRAVALLQQATQLDPANSLIQHDLDRALKISRAVHAKS